MKKTDDFSSFSILVRKISRRVLAGVTLGAILSFAGCANIQETLQNLRSEKKLDPFERANALFTAGNYEAAFKENQRVLAVGTSAPDIALFNMGLISAHSSNPRKDYPRALSSFKTLANQHPESPLTEQAKIWIQVLEEHQKIAGEREKLLDEKRSLTREREALSHEREKLKYTVEKSRQLDLEIEKRRRKIQSR
jgi:hypothetical protein